VHRGTGIAIANPAHGFSTNLTGALHRVTTSPHGIEQAAMLERQTYPDDCPDDILAMHMIDLKDGDR